MDATPSGLRRSQQALAAVIIGVLVALLLPATNAFAWGTDTGGEGNGGGTTDPGGNTGSPGGGGTGTSPYYYTSFNWNAGAHRECAATDSRGEELQGAIGYFRGLKEHFSSAEVFRNDASRGTHLAEGSNVELYRITCIYPPQYTDRQVRVVLSSEVTITRERPQSATLANARLTSPWQDGDHSVAGAYASNRLYASADVDLDEYGQYQARGETKSRYVTVREWASHSDAAGNTYRDEVISVGPIFTVDRNLARATVDCRGFHDGWVASSFTHTDCGPDQSTTTPIYQCVPDSGAPVTVNGEPTSSVAIFRNGEPNPVVFTPVRAEGVTNITGERTRWTRDDGSPWRENGVSVRDAHLKLSLQPKGQQLFTNDETTSWVGGIQPRVNLHTYWASGNANGNTITPWYSYAGEVRVETVVVTGLSDTGWETSTTMSMVNALAICEGTPLYVESVRAVAGG